MFKDGQKVRFKKIVSARDLRTIEIEEYDNLSHEKILSSIGSIERLRKVRIYTNEDYIVYFSEINRNYTIPGNFLESLKKAQNHPLTNIFK